MVLASRCTCLREDADKRPVDHHSLGSVRRRACGWVRSPASLMSKVIVNGLQAPKRTHNVTPVPCLCHILRDSGSGCPVRDSASARHSKWLATLRVPWGLCSVQDFRTWLVKIGNKQSHHETQTVYIIPVVLRYRHWLRTMYGDRFHCRSTASLLRFRALYQVLPVPHLDAATRAFYGVLVWGTGQVQSSAVGAGSGWAPLAYCRRRLFPDTGACCALFYDLPYLMNQATGEGTIT